VFVSDLASLKAKFDKELTDYVELNTSESPYFKTYKETFKIEND